MSKSLQTLLKFGGMLTVLFSATTYNPAKASAQSLLPDIHLLENGQLCLALCTSPKSTTPSQAIPPLSNQGIGALSSQVLQLPGQVLQLPQQILSPQGSPALRPNLPVLPNNLPIIPPNNPPATLQGVVPPGNQPAIAQGTIPPSAPQVMQQSAPLQGSRPSFLQKIAPVLPVMIQQLSK